MLCDCGHPATPSTVSGGYGTDAEGKTYCYDCCTERDNAALLAESRCVHYWGTDKGGLPSLTNWPGYVLGKLYPGRLHPWSRKRRYVSAVDCHGQRWHGVGAPGEWVTLRKAKA